LAHYVLENLVSQVFFALSVDFYYLDVKYAEDRPVVGELVLYAIVIAGEGCLGVITLAWVIDQLSLKLSIAAEENSVTPRRDSVLRRCIIDITILIIFVSRIESELRFLEFI